MEDKSKNTVLAKSKAFAVRVIKFYKFLCDSKKEYVISKQVMRSGTSIGANVRESVNAQSKSDFINKINIALKEANETQYWLEILYESDFISEQEYQSIYNDCTAVAKMLSAIVKTSKSNQEKEKEKNKSQKK